MFVEIIDKDIHSFERKIGYQRSNSLTTTSTMEILIGEINHQLLKIGREIGGKKERSATKKTVLKIVKSYVLVCYKMNKSIAITKDTELQIQESIDAFGPELRRLLDSFICIYEDSGFSFNDHCSCVTASDSKGVDAKDNADDMEGKDKKNCRDEEDGDDDEVCQC